MLIKIDKVDNIYIYNGIHLCLSGPFYVNKIYSSVYTPEECTPIPRGRDKCSIKRLKKSF